VTPVPVAIRRSTAADREAIARLAQLDSASPEDGDYLLAEEDGLLRAAVPVAGGAAIADPFQRTADLVAMLELRLAELAVAAPAAPRGRGLRVPAPRRRAPGVAALAPPQL
jgi:hypothetical protein